MSKKTTEVGSQECTSVIFQGTPNKVRCPPTLSTKVNIKLQRRGQKFINMKVICLCLQIFLFFD